MESPPFATPVIFGLPIHHRFVIPAADSHLSDIEIDAADASQLYDLLEKQIIPMFYNQPNQWEDILRNSLEDILPYFDSQRMVADYYDKLYNVATQYT